ncbi:MAG: type III-A CRISPR-associated protein Csm2 [Oceanobacter sp.]
MTYSNNPRGSSHARPRNNNGGYNDRPVARPLDTSSIVLATPSAQLFDTVADRTAKIIAETDSRDANKSTQLRGFYDEIVMWEQKSRRMTDEQFSEVLPLIRMINAKVAYAKGRKLVDDNYFNLIRHCLQQVESPATMRNCKLFLEAFMGFFKVYGK